MLDGLALTGWSGDRIEDAEGFFVYLRDLQTGRAWSIGHQPMRRPADLYAATWQPGLFEIARAEDGLEVRLEVCVPPDEPCEMRRITFANRTSSARRIEVTTYAEVVLADPTSHLAHPVFSKLFVQTEWDAARSALLAHRRPRAVGERVPWLVHAALGAAAAEHESDRSRFLGRGRRVSAPQALAPHRHLSGTVGNVLDPIVSLRWIVELPANSRVQRSFLLGATGQRQEAQELVHHFSRPGAVEAGFLGARRSVTESLARLEITARDAERFEGLAGGVLYGAPELGVRPQVLEGIQGPLDPVHPSVPGGRPFAVLHAESADGSAMLADALDMHRWWRHLGLPLELVVLVPGELPAALAALDPAARPVVLPIVDLEPAARQRLNAVARLVLGGPDACGRIPLRFAELGRFATEGELGTDDRAAHPETTVSASDPLPARLDGAIGGFSPDGREYVLRFSRGEEGVLRLPPQPWVNVVANERLGLLVSETGAGSTWSGNSREHRLTPWSNDPVTDPHGEAFYLRDDETGRFWSLLPGPAPGAGDYELRHGIGTTRCVHVEGAISTAIEIFVPSVDPLRIARVRIRNLEDRRRRLSIFAYARLVLGRRPEGSGRTVVTHIDADSRTLWARNPGAGTYARHVAFSTVVGPETTEAVHATADRARFIGRHGNAASPAALRERWLDGRAGAGLDPCAAHQVELQLAPGSTAEVAFLLGEGRDREESRRLVERYRELPGIASAATGARTAWSQLLDAIQVRTPSPALDLMMNAWLPYQVLSCRIWGRTAFYQSGGAFGFRDQLQDASALVYASPERLRGQIVLHAAHQFAEGDVLHWWHPPEGRGLRTRFADDLLWLPYLTAFYVATTGDVDVLTEQVPFLRAPQLGPGEDEAYLQPVRSDETGDLYAHCCRAIDRSLVRGAHGLPLFGTGDWNDGMNRVGREGRGESVWMGFFLYAVLGDFLPVCERRGDDQRLQRYATHRMALRDALETAGWDGGWYRRGYYDDGTPLGTQASDECRIDALVQAWAVISGAAPRQRAEHALDAVERHLVSEPDGIVRLLWPPFDRTPHDPGYIKGYIPGVRENGGQYTHAALWVVRALAELGRNDRATRLLEMLSPVTRAGDSRKAATYQVEPYVVAADVYGTPPHVGRGGWTWYTGSAGWMLRVLLESILGMQLEGGVALRFLPCIPDDWPEFSIDYRMPPDGTHYAIQARNPHRNGRGVREARFDGQSIAIDGGIARVPIVHDGGSHRVDLVLGGARRKGT